MTVRALQDRLAESRRAMDAVGSEPPPADEVVDALPATATLEELVEAELKAQLRRVSDTKQMNLSIMNAIKFLAVRAKLPVAFGSGLDEE